jgi:hypothetical protein
MMEESKMDNRDLGIYLREIDTQCHNAFEFADKCEECLSLSNLDGFWRYLPSFLTATAQVSKFLWPDNRSDRARGEQLRRFLGLEDTSPISSRELRNHFEHFDERLDSWRKSSTNRNMVDRSVGLISAYRGIELKDFLRFYDPETHKLWVQGISYDIPTIIQTLDEIHKTIISKEIA